MPCTVFCMYYVVKPQEIVSAFTMTALLEYFTNECFIRVVNSLSTNPQSNIQHIMAVNNDTGFLISDSFYQHNM